MNDPNGLIYHNGEYHLFYQHYPHNLSWGPMHWGHAVSTNLIDWEHLPIALYPAEDGWIFSGSAVIDTHNTAGFGAGAMVAIYTLHIEGNPRSNQTQGIAHSLDNGRSWTKYSGNPVIPMPQFEDHNDFRDPKVDWFGSSEDGHWFMILTVKDEVWIYVSPNLKDWELTSKFGQEHGCHGGVWECPDLFEMPVQDSNESVWVMLVSVQNGAPAGGNGVQYFLGHFDGKVFTPLEENPKTRWVDYGADFYAAVTFNHTPNDRRLLIGWMNNWPYSHAIPAVEWRGMQSFPRELILTTQEGEFQLLQKPIDALETHWDNVIKKDDFSVDGLLELKEFSAGVAEYNIVFEVNQETSADYFGARVRSGEDHHTAIGYSVIEKSVYIDRDRMGHTVPKMMPSSLHQAPIQPLRDRISLNILVDHESIEVWVNNGEVYLTELNYPLADNLNFELFANGGGVKVLSAVCKSKK